MRILLIILLVAATGAVWLAYDIPENTEPTAEKINENKKPPQSASFEYDLAPITVRAENGDETQFLLADSFKAAVAAEDLGKARFMSLSPDERLFVPDLVNYNLSHEGRVLVLENFDEETKKFRKVSTFLSNLRGPNSVAFYTDKNGKTWLYVALTAHLVRYPYQNGDTEPSGKPEVIIKFPDTQTPGETSVVWHITRTISIHKDRFYISIGSGCNSCEQLPGELRGMIISMEPDGNNVKVYAKGLRNSVGLTWAGNSLYATENGVDHLGPEAPDEVMYKITEGEHYGWPYCYESGGKAMPENSQKWEREFSCDTAPLSFSAFSPHAAPLGITYFEDAHPALKDHFLVALHGSFEPVIGAGHRVIRVSKSGEQKIFMDGFLAGGERLARPVHFLQYNENSFFMTDDHTGVLYYVYASDQSR